MQANQPGDPQKRKPPTVYLFIVAVFITAAIIATARQFLEDYPRLKEVMTDIVGPIGVEFFRWLLGPVVGINWWRIVKNIALSVSGLAGTLFVVVVLPLVAVVYVAMGFLIAAGVAWLLGYPTYAVLGIGLVAELVWAFLNRWILWLIGISIWRIFRKEDPKERQWMLEYAEALGVPRDYFDEPNA
jgi:hypothetical protein